MMSLLIFFKQRSWKTRYALADQLKQFGVSEFMAYKLTRNHPEEIISLALGRLKQVAVANPAGYLVSGYRAEVTASRSRTPPKPPASSTKSFRPCAATNANKKRSPKNSPARK